MVDFQHAGLTSNSRLLQNCFIWWSFPFRLKLLKAWMFTDLFSAAAAFCCFSKASRWRSFSRSTMLLRICI
jgi:hypothetical protein